MSTKNISLLEIWRRPDAGFPSVFSRAVRPKPGAAVPAVGDKLIHNTGARCTIVAKTVSGFLTIEWDTHPEGLDGALRGDFSAEDMTGRFVPVVPPKIEWERGPWEIIDPAYAKKALRAKTYFLPEFPGVTFAARRFNGDEAKPEDYAAVKKLREDHRAPRTRNATGFVVDDPLARGVAVSPARRAPEKLDKHDGPRLFRIVEEVPGLPADQAFYVTGTGLPPFDAPSEESARAVLHALGVRDDEIKVEGFFP